MANPGVGNKFVSVNLNRSYGKSISSGGGRARPSGHGFGGMVVLSKARSVVSSGQKGSRLSVPPPLNLPSLRKENEKIDPSSGTLIGASSGPGMGSGSSSIGWTKPHSSRIGEGEAKITSMGPGVGSGSVGQDAGARVSVYTPPGARGTVVEAPVPGVEKAVLLRGEDFPSLQASLPVAQSQLRMKEQQGQRQRQSDVESKEKGSKLSDGVLNSPIPLPMRPQMKPWGNAGTADENDGLVVSSEKTRKDERVLSDPLPMVRLGHSDWADDERDTSYKPERNRVRFPSRNERETELDAPRSSMPRSGNGSVFDAHSFQKNNSPNTLNSDRDCRQPSFLDAGRFALRDVYGRELPGNRSGRDENSWRGLPARKDGYIARNVGLKQNGGGVIRPTSLNKANTIDSKLERVTYSRNLSAKDSTWDGPGVSVSRPQDSYGQIGQKGNNSMEMVGGRSSEQSVVSRPGNPSSWTRGSTGDMVQNSVTSRSSFSLGAKCLPVNDPILSFGKDKRRTFSRNGKPYIEDGFMKDLTILTSSTFDGRDPFAPDILQFKKKKYLLKDTEFYDPVRESFEAELERVQKIQEQERQQILEEQARALELARKEEEERERLAREEAEGRRRLEEEAREAARRAEQERSEVARRAEEQKRAREEEKRQMLLEEERRKEAARQKLLELEFRIARRQAEVSKDERLMRPVEDSVHGSLKDKEHSRTVAGSQWEECERMVDRLTSSASSESSNLNRSYDASSRRHFSRDGNVVGFDRTKNVGSWKRDGHDVGSSLASFMQDSDYDDVVPGGKGFSRREFHGGPGYMSNRGFSKVGAPDILMNDDVSQIKVQGWNFSVDDHYSRRLDIDGENSLDRIEDLGWRQDQVQGGSHVLDAERLFQSSEIDGVSSGRSRHFVRQPRVLPPPSLTSVNKSSSRVNVGQSSSSTFVDGESGQHPLHKAAEFPGSDYGIGYHQSGEQSDLVNVPQDSQRQDKNEGELRCDSQSSLSVSSMPNSPTHLSHDDVEDSADSNAHRADYVHIVMSDNDSVMPLETENKVIAALVTSVSLEEEDWTVEGNGGSREQEEYDEEEDAYQEDDEVHEGDEENFDLAKDFRGLHVEQQVQTPVLQADLDLDNVEKVRPTEGNDFVETGVRLQQVAHGLASERSPPEASLVGVVQNSDENDQPKNNLSELHVPVSADETAKALQDLVPQPMNASSGQLSSTGHVDNNIESSESVLSVQQMHASAVVAASSSQPVQPILGGVSSVTRQTEVNVPMQFGLFSGPTLMPSPLPAIQIGSIRMPLHLHPQVGQPLTQLHPSQPSMFQFGQLSYPSPLTQRILPIPQTLSFVQPTVPSHYSINQQPAVSLHSQSGQEPPHNSHSTEKATTAADNLEYKQSVGPKLGVLSQENLTNETSLSVIHDIGSLGDKVPSDNSFFSANGFRSELLSHAGDQSNKDAITKKTHGHMITNRDSQDRVAGEPFSSNACPSKRVSSRVRDAISVPGARGGRVVYSVRSAGSEYPHLVTEASHVERNNFRRKDQRVARRTEFRVRENFDKKQADGSDSQGYSGQGMSDPNVRVDGMTSKGGGRKDFGVHKDTRQTLRPESGSSGHTGYHAIRSEGKIEKTLGSEAPTKRQTTLEKDHRLPDRNLKGNIVPEEDVDASLQSGVVRVFNQPGIEAPSDEDDFIEVRSKRQMLNDRREQREKEIKAKCRAAKGSRKPRALPKTDVKSSKFDKIPVSLAADGGLLASNAICAELSIPDGRLPNQKNVEVPSPFTSTVTSQSLPPIGTPAANTDVQADNRRLSVKAVQASSFPAVLGRGGKLVPGLSFDNNSGDLDNVSSSLGSWGSACANFVMPLTQTQLDEAMKPAHFDAQVSPPVDCSNLAKDTSQATASQDKSFSASLNSLNSLLAGEKIQFGAVTSHTVLPSESCAASKAIGPVSCMSNMPIEHKLSGAEGDCLTFFNKAKHSKGSQLEDPEAEAEAAASAIAVAAISNDEPIGNGLVSDSVSVIDAKTYGGVDVSALPAEAVASTAPLSSQSRSEESLSVSLPADLSVETPAPSLWPPLPSSQSSSGPMLSHFQGVPHSHFPCFEMNPMLGSPIFTFGSPESANGQLQAQRNITSGSGSLGAWQHHSGIDSFYGPPAGLTGPFVGPPGAIPGIQGPPHMVVYNHFGPVGQFGQMGLRLMGTTYVPSGKQPDWKRIPVSSTAAGMHDGNINNLNLVPGQCEPSIPMPIQHVAPGSPLMPIAPPLGLFDMSPFQPSPDLAAQARWSHVPAPSLHSLPLSASTSVPLQQAEVHPRQLSGTSMESSGIRFGEDLPLKPADGGKTFTTNDSAAQFPDDLGLGDASSGNGSLPVLTLGPRPYNVANVEVLNGNKISSTAASKAGDGGDIGGNSDSISANTHGNQSSGSTFALHAPQPQNSSQAYLNQVGNTEQKDRVATQKTGSAREWPRRHGLSDKNHTGAGDKNFSTSKMKQIYVAKPSSSSSTAN